MNSTERLLQVASLIESGSYALAYSWIKELNRDRNLGYLWPNEEANLNVMMANLLDAAAKQAGW